MINAAALNAALRDYFTDIVRPDSDLSKGPAAVAAPPEFKPELDDAPRVVVPSISERVAELMAAMAEESTPHVFPKNWTTCALWDAQGDDHFVGTAYINIDTGREFMVERDGKEYWL